MVVSDDLDTFAAKVAGGEVLGERPGNRARERPRWMGSGSIPWLVLSREIGPGVGCCVDWWELLGCWSWAGRAPRVAAQTGYLGPGEACYDDSQCGNTRYSPMFCADNGFDYDGALNCCAYEGGYCYSDEGCCGIASCITGSCVSPPSNAGAGDPCQTTDECFAGGLVCDYIGQTDDFRCCSYEGGGCGWDGDCCGSLNCIAGVCRDPGVSAGIPVPSTPG